MRDKLATYGLAFALLALEPLAAAELTFKITDAKKAPVADAVVSLVPLDHAPGAASAPTPDRVEITQENLEFLPYVTAVRVGTPVTFPNRDTVQHHVYSVSKPKNFELPLYVPGKAETIVFDQPGPVAVGCNIHEWMSAHVLVLETPFFAKTNSDGAATVKEAPAGRYRVEIWHPRLTKIETREITLGEAPAAPLSLTLALKADRRIRRSPQTKGGGYR